MKKQLCPKCNKPMILTNHGWYCDDHGLIEYWMMESIKNMDRCNEE